MTLTFLLTVLWSVEVGVAISVTISLLMVVHRSSRARMTILVRKKDTLANFLLINLNRVEFPERTNGHQFRKLLKPKKRSQAYLLFEFVRISILVGKQCSLVRIEGLMHFPFQPTPLS